MSFIDDYLAEHMGPLLAEREADQGHLVSPYVISDIIKTTGYLAVPDELLMDCGVIPDTRPVRVLTRRERFASWRRRTAERARTALAKRAYRLLSGEDVPEPEDWR